MSGVLDYGPLLADYDKEAYRNDNELAPQFPCGILIGGATGQGKTNLLLNLLTNPEIKMTHEKIYVCAPSIQEPAYLWLRDFYGKQREEALKLLKKQNPKSKITIDDIPENFVHISRASEIPEPAVESEDQDGSAPEPKTKGRKKKAAPAPPQSTSSIPIPLAVHAGMNGGITAPVGTSPVKKMHTLKADDVQKIVIVDDFTGDPIANAKVAKLIQKSRKVGTSLIILNHNIFTLDPTVKRNLAKGYIMLFETSTKTLSNQYFRDFGGTLSKEEFYETLNKATEKPYSFLTIDLKTLKPALKYREGITGTGLVKSDKMPEKDEKIKKIFKKAPEVELSDEEK